MKNFIEKAELLAKNKKYKEAKKILDTILKKEPKNTKALLLKANILDDEGGIENRNCSLNLYDKALKSANNPILKSYIYLEKAICLFRISNCDFEIPDLEFSGPENEEIRKKFNSFLKKAISSIDKSIELNPNAAYSYFIKAELLKDIVNRNWQKRAKQASLFYEKAISLEPTNVNYYVQNAINYFHLKEYKQSEKNYKKSVELGSLNYTVIKDYAIILFKLKKYEEAFDFFNKAMKFYFYELDKESVMFSDPFFDFEEEYFLCAKKLKKYEAAWDFMKRCVENNMYTLDYALASWKLATNNDAKFYKSVEKKLKTIIKENPKDFLSYIELGFIENKLNKFKKSIKSFDTSLSIIRKNKDLKRNINFYSYCSKEYYYAALNMDSYESALSFTNKCIEEGYVEFSTGLVNLEEFFPEKK